MISILGIVGAVSLAITPMSETVEATYKEPEINYITESVTNKGLLYEFVDEADGSKSLLLSTDYDFGYEVYDDKTTSYIDGIAWSVNANKVYLASDWKIPNYKSDTDYTILVNIVYTTGFGGTVRKMLDGTYDYSELITNPLVLLQLAYYLLAALSIIITAISALKKKKWKAVTTQDLTNVATAQIKLGIETAKGEMLDTLLPYFKDLAQNNASVVKAITVSTMKGKNAPLAMLDTLKETTLSSEKIISDTEAAVTKQVEANAKKTEALNEFLEQTKNGITPTIETTDTGSNVENTPSD